MPTLYFEYELNENVKCSISGLPFDSTIELADDDELYQDYCRTCYTCYSTLGESAYCCNKNLWRLNDSDV